MSFDRPTGVPVLIEITTTNGNVDNITQAVLDYANGLLTGLAGFVIGADVSPFEIAGAIMSQYPSYYISLVEVSLQSPMDFTTDPIEIAVNEIAQTQLSYITVNVS